MPSASEIRAGKASLSLNPTLVLCHWQELVRAGMCRILWRSIFHLPLIIELEYGAGQSRLAGYECGHSRDENPIHLDRGARVDWYRTLGVRYLCGLGGKL